MERDNISVPCNVQENNLIYIPSLTMWLSRGPTRYPRGTLQPMDSCSGKHVIFKRAHFDSSKQVYERITYI